jgi:glycosyltransferase involved in cell wall biosynthesis
VKILFVSKGIEDPTSRYRVLPLQSRLRDKGIESINCHQTEGVFGKLRLLQSAKKVDLIFIQRKLFHPWLIKILKRLCNKIVFDFDDAIFCRSNGKPSATRMKRFQKIIDASSLVLAGNQYLADQCGAATKAVIPTPVDETLYLQSDEKAEGIVLVWVGSRSTRKYLENHRSTFEAIGAEIPGLVLKVIADFDFQLSNLKVRNIPWQNETEANEIARSHIGIAPMPDNPWTRGKCALKVIQYMAAGLPVVSSRTGANQEVVVEGETGLLADSTQEWVAAIHSLSKDKSERERMGALGLKRMKHEYSQSAVVASMVKLLERYNLIH